MRLINHGTTRGYYQHRRLSDEPCDDCKDAINKYMAKYRRESGAVRSRERDKLRRRALAVLREKYRDEYEEILKDLEIESLV